MNDTHASNPADQRKALDQSEQKANEKQPGSYKPEATNRKVVEVEHIEGGRSDSAIKGIDPEK